MRLLQLAGDYECDDLRWITVDHIGVRQKRQIKPTTPPFSTCGNTDFFSFWLQHTANFLHNFEVKYN